MRARFAIPLVRPFALLAALLLALAAGLLPAPAVANDTPGNNGTVKIHLADTEKEPGEVRNEPHVCTFHLHFYFSDPEQAGTWEIQKWAPGDKGEVVLDGTYDTHGDGEDRQPEQDVYRLPNGHYKLFWDGDLDTHKHDKMKVFWVDCPTTQPTSQPTPVAASAPPSQAPSESAPGGVGGPSGPPSATPPGGGVGGPSGPPSATPSGSELAVGGVSGPSSPPTGEVQGIVGTPAATLPSTDTIGTASAANDTGWRLSVMIFAAVVALLAMLVPAPKRLTGPDHRDRR